MIQPWCREEKRKAGAVADKIVSFVSETFIVQECLCKLFFRIHDVGLHGKDQVLQSMGSLRV